MEIELRAVLSEESLCRVEVLNRRTSIVAAQCHLGEALVVEARLHEAPLALALLEAAAEVLLCLVDEGESKRQRASCLIGAPVFAGSRLHPRRYVEGWRQGASSYLAESFVNAGAAFTAINFGLVPDVSLDEQVRQWRAALSWIHRNATAFNADPERFGVSRSPVLQPGVRKVCRARSTT